jgi:hypothetical protein
LNKSSKSNTFIGRNEIITNNQLIEYIFGKECDVLDRLPHWTKIRSTLDGQEGWVDFKILNKKHVWVGRAIPTLRMLYLCLLSGWRGAFQRMA